MIKKVKIKKHKFEKYRDLISKELYNEIVYLSKKIGDKKIYHLNSTSSGGGVAEILKSLIPLMCDLGLDARWYAMGGNKEFFEVTKKVHNALQGDSYKMPLKDRKIYLEHSANLSREVSKLKPDLWVIHDPQPLAINSYLDNFPQSISHIHIDLSSSNKFVWDFFYPFFSNYEALIFSSQDYLKEDLKEKSFIFQPAIDAFSSKNKNISIEMSRDMIKACGLDINRPIISQVSRFDFWKNPLGVIDIYRQVKKKIPGLQLILLGVIMAQDDPESFSVLKKVKEKVGKDKDIHIFSSLDDIKSFDLDLFVNAVQRSSDIIIQNSIKEGFGLTVTEAMWKKKPVVATNVGGIKLQIDDGVDGFLIENQKDAVNKILEIFQRDDLLKKISQKAHLKVSEKFLMPRLLRDYLSLISKLL